MWWDVYVLVEVEDTEELEAEVVEVVEDALAVVDVDEGAVPSMLETIPSSKKYWADGSVAMMSSPKTLMPTTMPFLYWCVYEAMRFFESLTKTDTIEVPVILVIEFSSCAL